MEQNKKKEPFRLNYALVFASALITLIIQNILYSQDILKSPDLLMDFISYLLIYVIIYVLFYLVTNLIKKKLIIRHIMICIVVLLVAGLALIRFYSVRPTILYAQSMSNAQEKSPKELINLMENKDSFIFIYTSEDCPYCVRLMPQIADEIEASKTLPVYYVDRKNTDECQKLASMFNVETIPFLVKVEDGEITGSYFEDPINFFG